jgi:hypothetical protein
MDPQMTQIFAPLKQAIESQPLALADLMEIIGGFSGTSPGIAQAMSFHARDIDIEGAASSYPTLISEVYRRTFFDIEHATKYGTTDMLDQGSEVLTDFVTHMVGSITMDAAQDARGGTHLPAPGQH